MFGGGPSLLLIGSRLLGGVSGPSSSLVLRSIAHAGLFVILESGTSSSFLAGVFDGYFMGDLGFPVPLVFDGVFGGLGFWVPEDPGCGSLGEDSDSFEAWVSPSLNESVAEVTLLSCSFSDLVSLFRLSVAVLT